MPNEILMAFIDYENIRRGFKDYVQYVRLEDIVRAFEELGSELGELRGMNFYGDWTRRPVDARTIEERGYRAVNVLSTRFGKDRSDPAMSFAIDDLTRENQQVTAILLGSGDADFKEAIIRGRQRGKRFYVLCFGRSASRELFTSTQGVYPLEVRLSLTEKPQIQPSLPGIPTAATTDSEWANLIDRLNDLERTLPKVVKNYFRDRILLPSQKFGETSPEVDLLIQRAIDEGIIEAFEIPNPQIPGKSVRAIRLNRGHAIVRALLEPKNEEAGN